MSQPSSVNAIEYAGGVICVDSGYVRPRLAGAWILEAADRVAIIETGTSATAPKLMKVLHERGWKLEQVEYVIVTHVHLDHAGGAGVLMRDLPDATFVVHPRGARHMADPSRLEASVRAVYSDEYFEETFAPLLPIDPARTREMGDGETLRMGGRELHFIDTPGHARHHFCVWDEQTCGWFTGDTFGISYREFDTTRGPFIFPTTTPIELDPPRLRESVACLLERDPEWMYLTHYGRVGEPKRLAESLLDTLDAMVAMAERYEQDENRTELIRSELRDHLVAAARAHGVTMPDERLEALLENDIDLNTQGLEVWLERRKKV